MDIGERSSRGHRGNGEVMDIRATELSWTSGQWSSHGHRGTE